MEQTTETFIKSENRQEAIDKFEFLNSLEMEEKENLLIFLQGARFAKSLMMLKAT